MLCLPCYFDDLCRNTLVSLTELFSDTRQMSIAPGRFDHDSSEMSITGLGDAASSNALATGVFARDHAAIAHQLPCTLKTRRDVAQFRSDRDGRDMRHTTQRLQAANQFLHRRGSQLYYFENGLFQPLDPQAHVLDLVHAIQSRHFLRRLRVANLREPPHVT